SPGIGARDIAFGRKTHADRDAQAMIFDAAGEPGDVNLGGIQIGKLDKLESRSPCLFESGLKFALARTGAPDEGMNAELAHVSPQEKEAARPIRHAAGSQR